MKQRLKGKSKFTVSEIKELKRLITLRINPKTTKTEQKGIREKMRKVGFFGGDDWGIYDCQVCHLDCLIKLGKITINKSLK